MAFDRICKHCQKTFSVRSRQLPNKFCSHRCAWDWYMRPEVVEAKFWTKITKTPTCWLFNRTPNKDGYGTICVAGVNWTAHRYAWTLLRGPIPKGKLLLHRCDVPACVNPAHLFLGTDADNSADKIAKLRHSYGERNHKAKLTYKLVRWARRLRASGMTVRDIHAHLKVPVTYGTLLNAVNGKKWKVLEL